MKEYATYIISLGVMDDSDCRNVKL